VNENPDGAQFEDSNGDQTERKVPTNVDNDDTMQLLNLNCEGTGFDVDPPNFDQAAADFDKEMQGLKEELNLHGIHSETTANNLDLVGYSSAGNLFNMASPKSELTEDVNDVLILPE
jgi:hypothetical protein